MVSLAICLPLSASVYGAPRVVLSRSKMHCSYPMSTLRGKKGGTGMIGRLGSINRLGARKTLGAYPVSPSSRTSTSELRQTSVEQRFVFILTYPFHHPYSSAAPHILPDHTGISAHRAAESDSRVDTLAERPSIAPPLLPSLVHSVSAALESSIGIL
jgi:hypothetical protein